jgi:hypothetical protein
MKAIFGLLLAVSFCLENSAAPSISKSLSGTAYQIASTLRVVTNVCACKADKITDKRAADFFNCYDKAPVS